MGYAPNNVPFAPKPKTPPPPKKDNPTKDAICYQYGEVRHWKRRCPMYLAELMKKRSYLGEGLRGSKKLNQEVENQLGKTIKSLRSNHGGEYMSQEFLDHLKEHGIIAHRTPPYTPQPNGVSERINRTLIDMVDKTPYEIWHGQAPKLPYLKVCGCKTLVKHDTLTKPDKLDSSSFRCIFVGYPNETMGYSFYSPFENKVFVSWNAEFFENDLIDLKASGSVKDLELIQEEDTNPSLDTSLDHEEDDQEIDEPQSDFNPIRESFRTRRALDCMCLYIDVEEHELGDLGEPTNYKAALLDPESKQWLDAMNVEMQSMKDNDKKTDMDGAVYVFIARLVAKVYTQTYGVDYEETFSHVADIRAIRILIAIVAYYNYKIWQMDVKTSFLNGNLSEEVYMEKPEDFVNLKYPNYEAIWIRKFISGLGIVPTIEEPISMYCENTRAIAISKDDRVTKGARHFGAKVHYLCETIKLGDVKIEKVDTYDNLADPFTKALAFPKHSELTRNIGMLPASSFM
nr:hypothetical protein [Tanacetum cinerariifolium]